MSIDNYNKLVVDIAGKVGEFIDQEIKSIPDSHKFLIHMRVVNVLTYSTFKPLIRFQNIAIDNMENKLKEQGDE